MIYSEGSENNKFDYNKWTFAKVWRLAVKCWPGGLGLWDQFI